MNKHHHSTTIKGEYRHYRQMPDGTLRFMGIVKYEFSPALPDERRNAEYLKYRNEQDLADRERDCEWFENLADTACEGAI